MPFIDKNFEFQLDDNILKYAAKSAARSALKEKFMLWDSELEEEKIINSKLVKWQKQEIKVAPIGNSMNENIQEFPTDKSWNSWGKIAMAACILIGISFVVKLILDSDSQMPDNFAVSTNKPVNNQTNSFESEVSIPDPEESTIFRQYLNDSQGFIGSDKKQKIVIINFYKRIQALNSSLNLLKKKGNTDKIISEIDSLKRLHNTYLLNNNGLKINIIDKSKVVKIINLSNKGVYLRMGSNYYKLNESDNFKPLLIEKDSTIIEHLDRIIITNPN
jgi:hypothetical protein